MNEKINIGGRGYGKSASDYSKIISNNNYPSQVSLFQKNEINMLWESGKTMAAVQKLQSILENIKPGKTLL